MMKEWGIKVFNDIGIPKKWGSTGNKKEEFLYFIFSGYFEIDLLLSLTQKMYLVVRP